VQDIDIMKHEKRHDALILSEFEDDPIEECGTWSKAISV